MLNAKRSYAVVYKRGNLNLQHCLNYFIGGYDSIFLVPRKGYVRISINGVQSVVERLSVALVVPRFLM
jgi:hypothetical protein